MTGRGDTTGPECRATTVLPAWGASSVTLGPLPRSRTPSLTMYLEPGRRPWRVISAVPFVQMKGPSSFFSSS